MTLQELEDIRERAGYEDPGSAFEDITALGDYVYSLRDAALGALSVLENLKTDDLYLEGRRIDAIERLQGELNE